MPIMRIQGFNLHVHCTTVHVCKTHDVANGHNVVDLCLEQTIWLKYYLKRSVAYFSASFRAHVIFYKTQQIIKNVQKIDYQ